MVAGLLYLQHADRLSDVAVIARWVENPYYQHFIGETFFQHLPPIDPSSLTRWRGRIGEEGVEWPLTQTIQAGQKSGVIDEGSAKRVAVDFTSGPGNSWWHWRKNQGYTCGSPTLDLPRGLRCRSAAMPMPNSSSACARH